MADLPGGTVTFLFTDIEGSTTRWERQPAAMGAALARHDALLRAAIGQHAGHVFKTVGDAFCAVFARASDAVAAALEAQRRLRAEEWGEIGPLRVRMALHTGAAVERDGDYLGPPLNRVARLLSAGHGGQVLLSRATFELVRDALPEGASLVDLGEHRLKDLIRPERVFQLAGPDLPTELPPLRTLGAPDNPSLRSEPALSLPKGQALPAQTGPLLGREGEVAALRERLLQDDVRLLTVTGPGGTGKTRLSLQVAAELIDRLADGVFFVALAQIRDPELVASTIAQTLGLRDAGGRPVLQGLKAYLRERQVLLVLDNFEQILPAAQCIAELLEACPRLKILVTSRAALHLRGEQEFALGPLRLPDPKSLPPAEELAQYAAVALFVERARAVRAEFAITDENAPIVAEICVRLDGLPLAIELAAARIRLLPPRALLARLVGAQGLTPLQLLIGGPRDAPTRQRTLRDTIAWSYDLLNEGGRRLFRRLAVFVGGCTLEAAETVCWVGGEPPIDVLDGATALIDQSLVRQEEQSDGQPRLTMLETIREYGLEQLGAGGELEAVQRRHAEFFTSLAGELERRLRGPNEAEWLNRLEAEQGNFRAVLRWAVDHAEAEIGLRLGAAVSRFWAVRGHLGEARGWLTELLALPTAAARTPERARALNDLGNLARNQGDYAAAGAWYREGLSIRRELSDELGVARALTYLGMLARLQGDHAAARSLFDESLVIMRQLGDQDGIAFLLNQFGLEAYAERDLAAARAQYEQALRIRRELGNKGDIAVLLTLLGQVAHAERDYATARALHTESLTIERELGNKRGIAHALGSLAVVDLAEHRARRAALLFGAAEALRAAIDVPLPPGERHEHDRAVASARAVLGDQAFAAAWADGRAMTLERAIACALGEESPA